MTTRRGFLVGLGTTATVAGLAGCGYRPGGGDVRWRADGDFAGFRTEALDVTDGLVVTVADSTTSFDIEREEWVRGGEIAAYSTEDGSALWSDHLESELSCHSVGDGGAAVGFDGTVVRYGADGEQWRIDLGASLLALAVADGRAYAISEGGDLVACADGAELWRVDLGPELGSDEGGFGPALAASAETVVCWVGGSVVCLDPDGRRRWRQSEINVRLFSIADGEIVASGASGLAAIDGSTGEMRWLGHERVGRFAVTPDAVYGTYDTELTAYDRSGGRKWSTGDDPSAGRNDREAVEPDDYMGRVAADNEGVYVDSSRGLTALDPGDGSVRWRVQNRSLSAGPFLVDGGVLVVADGELVCHYAADQF
ncbi:outer membrane protein assembly factor BamB family protein [Halosimplex amylolyticum]|uniref:outer membrane protein assembly factor BamB family protein n=1 Tax=Halosimplex amylolyticum TaxID=3396616 RepID=UPI003F57DA33